MKAVLRYKIGPGRGWWGPPKGTHTAQIVAGGISALSKKDSKRIAKGALRVGTSGNVFEMKATAIGLGWSEKALQGMNERQLRQVVSQRISPPVGEWLSAQGDIVAVYHGTTDRILSDARKKAIQARPSAFVDIGQEAGAFVVPGYNVRWAEYWANRAHERGGGNPVVVELHVPKQSLRVDVANPRDFLYSPTDIPSSAIGKSISVRPISSRDFSFHVKVPHPMDGLPARVQVKDMLAGVAR